MEESMNPIFVLEDFENTIDSELGPITTDEDVEKCIHPKVYDTKCCGIECSQDENIPQLLLELYAEQLLDTELQNQC